MNRTRLFVVVALVLLAVVVVVALASVNTAPAPAPVTTDNTTTNPQAVAQQPVVVNTPEPTPTAIPFIEVVIAVQDIPRGSRVQANTVALVPWPEVAAPQGAFSNIEDVIGRIARTDIYREQILLANTIVDDLQSIANSGSDAAAVIPPNRVAVAIPIDRITSVAYAVQPGDRVDVIVSMLFVDIDPNFQSIEPNTFSFANITYGDPDPLTGVRPFSIQPSTTITGELDSRILPDGTSSPVIVVPSEPQRPRLATQRTVEDALVVWLGDFPEDGRIFRPAATPTPIVPTATPGGEPAPADVPPTPTPLPPRPDIITLAVPPQEAVVLTWFAEAGIPMTFALRSAQTTNYASTETVTLDYILTRFNIAVPEKVDYSLQPAITRIREIELNQTIDLNP